MKIFDLASAADIARATEAGYIYTVQHPKCDLRLYTYTPKAVEDNAWNAATLNLRGLIATSTGEIISRSFEKFFEVGTPGLPEMLPENFPTNEPEILELLDGWIGIPYEYEGWRGVATKNSFTSPVAMLATAMYNSRYAKGNWPTGFTPVFEIIHPTTKLVVNYDFADLVLTALVNNLSGEHMPWKHLAGYAEDNGMRAVEQVFGKKPHEVMFGPSQNKQGYVFKWHLGSCPPLMAKYKFDSYRQAIRVMKACNARAIWDLMRTGQSVDNFLEMPFIGGAYKDWVRKIEADIEQKRAAMEQHAFRLNDQIPEACRLPSARAQFGKWLADTCKGQMALATLVWMIARGKDYQAKLWEMVAPEPRPFLEER